MSRGLPRRIVFPGARFLPFRYLKVDGMKFYLQTFGCKVNRYDTEVIAELLAGEGHIRVSNPALADFQVVNTCTVTKRAETKAVRYIRSAGRNKSGSALVVVGCAVERDPDRFAGLPGVELSLGTKEKYNLPRLLGRERNGGGLRIRHEEASSSGNLSEPGGLHDFKGRKRAFLKIQDGCNYGCSYCIIPAVRGRSVSRSADAIIEEARSLISSGFREIVLTGIHIGLYGRDLSPQSSLVGMVEKLLGRTVGARFRLSSLDAPEAGSDLISLMAESDRVCNHLHIPLQSGSPRILKAMRRRGSVELFKEVCSRAVEALPSIGLGTDLIVGFPGETAADFEDSLRIVEEIPFSYAHIFPYSPRPGTPACEMKNDAVQDGVIRERAALLGKLAAESGREFRVRQAGNQEKIIVEKKEGTCYVGRCSNYTRAYLRCDHVMPGELVDVSVGAPIRDGVEVSARLQRSI